VGSAALAVMLHVGLGCFRRVMHRVLVMAMCQVRMMCCRFVTARFMMRCVFVMLGYLMMMLCRLL
jgi:hypothetical protein